jgi:fumarate reductase subunit D
MRGSSEPFFWLLFSAGGMLAAILLPGLVFLLWIAFPLGWVEPPAFETLLAAVRHPLTRFGLFALIALSMFHWGHRFRYTLYDGLQLKHLYTLIACICYGGAVAITLFAAWTLWFLA